MHRGRAHVIKGEREIADTDIELGGKGARPCSRGCISIANLLQTRE